MYYFRAPMREAAGLGGPGRMHNPWIFFGNFKDKILQSGAFWTHKMASARL